MNEEHQGRQGRQGPANSLDPSVPFVPLVPAVPNLRFAALPLPRILVCGYGNPGRQDDGLGVRFAECIEAWATSTGLGHIHCRTDIQLNIEHALSLTACDTVVFADATTEADAPPFRLRPLSPAPATAFSTHALTPETVLAWAVELYDARPTAYLLTLRGESWNLEDSLSPAAAANLEAALAFVKPIWCFPRALPHACADRGCGR